MARGGAFLAIPLHRLRLFTLCVLALHAVAVFDPVSQLESPSEASHPLVGRSLTEAVESSTEPMQVSSWVDPVAEAEELLSYPVDRSLCDSRDVPCRAGTRRLAQEFPQMLTEEPVFENLQDYGIEFLREAMMNRKRKFIPPEGTIIDYSGGRKLPPAPYKVPESYTNSAGGTTFVTKDVVIRVTSSSFEPTHSIVQPGSTVTFSLDTFETVRVKTRATPQMTNLSFDSDFMNHNFGITSFVFRPAEVGFMHFDNVALAPWEGRFSGTMSVSTYNCSSYTTCTSCLIYTECVWCGGNGTCIERNATNNLPYDTGVVVAIPYVEVSATRSYSHIRYMEGYVTKTQRFEFDWYPWPPIRTNPRPVDRSQVPTYFEPTESDSCSAYFPSRDAEQCPDYKTPPPVNRVPGTESEDRPSLPDFFACYEHVRATWSVSDVPEPVAWTEWPAEAEAYGADEEEGDSESIVATALCCSVCSSCATDLINACNISCSAGFDATGLPPGPPAMPAVPAPTPPGPPGMPPGPPAQPTPSESAAVCPPGLIQSGMIASIAEACQRASSCSSFQASAESPCPLDQSTAFSEPAVGTSQGAEATPIAVEDSGERRRLETEYIPLPSLEDAAAKAIREAVSAARSGRADWGAVSIVAEAGLLDDLWAARSSNHTHPRRRSENVRRLAEEDDDVQVDEWGLVPKWQQNLFKKTKNIDLWATLYQTMREMFGHRCNATMGCDRVRGACLNTSNLPIIGYDQNGTCTCRGLSPRYREPAQYEDNPERYQYWDDERGPRLQELPRYPEEFVDPWFTGDECNVPITDKAACVGMGDDAVQCARVRNKLFTCGAVGVADGLPDECIDMGLDVIECGAKGYLRGRRDALGVPNEIGRPEQGYASSLCAKCISRGNAETGEMRPETAAKTCSRPEVLHACQRMEDATNQRICNYCTEDTQGSTLPGGGNLKTCSFFRGTCMGSVEQRIRGVVPPNVKIVGHNEYGGLRYCKKPAPFTMKEHYLKEEDIVQVGQSCIDHTAYFTNWDFTRQKNHRRTVKDALGLKCKDPNNERTCPVSRYCVSEDLCPEDNPDWTDMNDIVDAWGIDKLIPLSDQGISGEAAAAAEAGTTDELRFTFETHKKVLDPQTAYLQPTGPTTGEPFVGNWPYLWPFLDPDYLERYTKVKWSVDDYVDPPTIDY